MCYSLSSVGLFDLTTFNFSNFSVWSVYNFMKYTLSKNHPCDSEISPFTVLLHSDCYMLKKTLTINTYCLQNISVELSRL